MFRILLLASLLAATATGSLTGLSIKKQTRVWRGESVQDLHAEYQNIFTHGNRNAASHLWATFLFERAHQMTETKLLRMFSGFCAVSGSPVQPRDQSRYFLRLPSVVDDRALVSGFMYFCCWPCVCDTQDFIRADTLTVETLDGAREYNVAVIGNPCDRPEKMTESFVQPFGHRRTNLVNEAPMLSCAADGTLEGATMSDGGYVIISIFFKAPVSAPALRASVGSHTESLSDIAVPRRELPEPGRMRKVGRVNYQDEFEFSDMCQERAAKGYNSGMGEIFRRVAGISPIGSSVGSELGYEVRDLK